MRKQICDKCKKKMDYPFYSIVEKQAPVKTQEKSKISGNMLLHIKYPSKTVATICKECYHKMITKEIAK